MQNQPSKSENSRGQNTTFLHRGGKFNADEAIELQWGRDPKTAEIYLPPWFPSELKALRAYIKRRKLQVRIDEVAAAGIFPTPEQSVTVGREQLIGAGGHVREKRNPRAGKRVIAAWRARLQDAV